MRNLLFSIVTSGILLTGTVSWAAQLTLQECLERARQHNPTLKAAAWAPRIAEQDIRQSTAANYPRVDAQAGYTMQQAAQGAKIAGTKAETQQADYATAGLSATYTIYDFGRRNARQRMTAVLADSSTQSFEARRTDVALQVIETYFSILETGKLISAAEDEVTQVEEHRRVSQALFEEGVVTRNDVLQAEVRLAATKQKLLTMKNNRENNWLQLNFLTGSQPGFRAELDEGITLPNGATASVNESDALSRRHDIQALRLGVEAGDLEVRESKTAFYPELYTQAALNYVQNDKALEQAIMAATIGIKVNLFDGFASTAAIERAVRNRSRSQDALRQAETQVRLEIDTSRNDVNVARERIGVAQTAIRQSEENLRINRERYRERVGTATEVLDAQTLVTQAKTDYYSALYDYQVSQARLKRAAGEL
ncbi:TolC family protein [Geobacter sp. FeAm09]|uniref:TolC family protein n=1 Tax=Geobacter sp. FeAm09 TaxID=2597769 RepID=UPI0011EF3C62|nr:TolC family protein [Geobacter sp. FeAm09]QEM68486.1 TolC family protein [Geobacter sp. FeAm09]